MSANEDRIFQSEADFWKEQMRLKAYRDLKNSLDTKWEEGLETGREEGLKVGRGEGQKAEKIETAKRILAKGYPIEDVMDITSLTREEIEKLKDK